MAEGIVIPALRQMADAGTLQLCPKGFQKLKALGGTFFAESETANPRWLLRLRGKSGPSFQVTVWLPGTNSEEAKAIEEAQTFNTICKLFDITPDYSKESLEEVVKLASDDIKDKETVKEISVYHGTNKKTEAAEVRVEWPVGL